MHCVTRKYISRTADASHRNRRHHPLLPATCVEGTCLYCQYTSVFLLPVHKRTRTLSQNDALRPVKRPSERYLFTTRYERERIMNCFRCVWLHVPFFFFDTPLLHLPDCKWAKALRAASTAGQSTVVEVALDHYSCRLRSRIRRPVNRVLI